MEKPTFYIVDVFAEEKYAGNQLAVFRGAGHLPDTTLQKIAAEMNYSEKSFKKDKAFSIRGPIA